MTYNLGWREYVSILFIFAKELSRHGKSSFMLQQGPFVQFAGIAVLLEA
jgi:hypothetical protein